MPVVVAAQFRASSRSKRPSMISMSILCVDMPMTSFFASLRAGVCVLDDLLPASWQVHPPLGGLTHAPLERLGQGVGAKATGARLSRPSWMTWVCQAWLVPRVSVPWPLAGRRGSGADATPPPRHGA
eukprot:3121022-Pleurochrysis_carterae.AAC.2